MTVDQRPARQSTASGPRSTGAKMSSSRPSPSSCGDPAHLGPKPRPSRTSRSISAASGLDVDVWDLDDSIKELPNAGDSGVPFPGRPNVAGIRKGPGGGRSLIVQGHIDVVSPEPVAAWSYDPWQATDRRRPHVRPRRLRHEERGRPQPVAAAPPARSRHPARRRSHRPERDRGGMHRQWRPRRRPPLPRRRGGHHRADRRPLHPRPRRRPLVPHRHRRQVMACDAGLAGRECHHQGHPDHASPAGPGRPTQPADAPGVCRHRAPDQSQYRGHQRRRLAEHRPGRVRAALPVELLPRSDRRGDPARDRVRHCGSDRGRSLVRGAPAATGLGRVPERGLDRVDGRAVSPASEPLAPAGLRRTDGAQGRHRASTTCAITTSPGSPPAATARPVATGMPPTNGSICAPSCPQQRCSARSCSTGAESRPNNVLSNAPHPRPFIPTRDPSSPALLPLGAGRKEHDASRDRKPLSQRTGRGVG